MFILQSINYYTKKRKEEIIIKNPSKFDLQNRVSVRIGSGNDLDGISWLNELVRAEVLTE